MLTMHEFENIKDGHGNVGYHVAEMNVHFYQVEDLLIDTGCSTNAKAAGKYFKTAGISRVSLTHVHEDHAGMAAWIQKNLNLPIYLHAGDHDAARQKTRLPLYRRIVWGNRAAFEPLAMPERFETENHVIDVIHAPGHSPNHVVFLEKKRGWLFTGDLFIGTRQNVAFKDENIADAIDTLKKLINMDWDIIFCGHSGIKTGGRELFRLKLQFFEDIRGRVQELQSQGFSIPEINKILFPKKDLWYIVSRGEWSSLKMIQTAVRDN